MCTVSNLGEGRGQGLLLLASVTFTPLSITHLITAVLKPGGVIFQINAKIIRFRREK